MENRSNAKRGVTLLELMLALGLCIVILILVGAAMDLNVRAFDSRRTHVEEAQLARAILKMIGDDLRNTVRYKPLNFSSLQKQAENLIATTAAAANPASSPTPSSGSGGNNTSGNSGNSTTKSGPSSGGLSGSSGSSQKSSGGTSSPAPTNPTTSGVSSGSSSSTSSGAATDSDSPAPDTEEAVVLNRPGLYGTQYQMQVDMCRLPRLDEYGGAAGFVGIATDIPSDVKSVIYALRASDSLSNNRLVSQSGAAMGFDGTTPGLVRRTVDLAVQRYKMNTGNSTGLETFEQLVAPEVTSIEFRYFNGTEWFTEWDSDLVGGLPVAVEILLAIQPAVAKSLNAAPGQTPDARIYRHVVRLPVARPTQSEQSESSASSSSTGSASSSSSGSNTSQGAGS